MASPLLQSVAQAQTFLLPFQEDQIWGAGPNETAAFHRIVSAHPQCQPQPMELNFRMIPHVARNTTGLMFLALVALFVFAGIRNYFARYYQNLVLVFSSLNTTKRAVKDQLESEVIASAWYYLLFFLSSGMLLFYALRYFHLFPTNHNPWLVYWGSVGVLILYYLLKRYVLKIVSWSFQKKEVAGQFIFHSAIVNEFIGVLLFPACILLLLVQGLLFKVIFWLALVVFGILLIYRYFRVFRHIKNLLRIDLFHFLIYLCAFEIMPILIIIKMSV